LGDISVITLIVSKRPIADATTPTVITRTHNNHDRTHNNNDGTHNNNDGTHNNNDRTHNNKNN
jgi:hypothetical protein